jgi:Methyltransferase FkbM domain
MDVSFETELIHRAGCEVHTFDPGDESAAYVHGLGEPKLHFDQDSLMREKGHDHIDLLRYHVEGSEYEIFDPKDLRRWDVQILGIRFFHTAPAGRALELIKAIKREGYMPVAREVTGFTFVHKGLPEHARKARRKRTVQPPVHRHARQRSRASSGTLARGGRST